MNLTGIVDEDHSYGQLFLDKEVSLFDFVLVPQLIIIFNFLLL